MLSGYGIIKPKVSCFLGKCFSNHIVSQRKKILVEHLINKTASCKTSASGRKTNCLISSLNYGFNLQLFRQSLDM